MDTKHTKVSNIKKTHERVFQIIANLHGYVKIEVKKILEKRNWLDKGFELSRKNYRNLEIDGYKSWLLEADELSSLNLQKTLQQGLSFDSFYSWCNTGKARQLSYDLQTNSEMMVFFCMSYISVTDTSYKLADSNWQNRVCSHVGYFLLWFELLRKILQGYEYTIHSPNANVTERVPTYDQGQLSIKLAHVLSAEYNVRHKNHHRLAEKMTMTMRHCTRETDVLIITDYNGLTAVNQFIAAQNVKGRKYFITVINNRFEGKNLFVEIGQRLLRDGIFQGLGVLINRVIKYVFAKYKKMNIQTISTPSGLFRKGDNFSLSSKYLRKYYSQKGIYFLNSEIKLNYRKLVKSLKNELSENFKKL